MSREKIFDLLAVILIGSFGLFTAYVCFGILQSQANAEINQYSVSGAIAGALVSWSLLSSVYLQFRKSSDELQRLRESNAAFQEKLIQADEINKLQEQNEELQQKLLRGAPRPSGYEIEVSERQRLVLARPKDWQPRGGVLFDFELPDHLLLENDLFPARFDVTFVPISEETESMDDFYDLYRQSAYTADGVSAHTCEYVFLGGELHGIKSLKIIAHEFVLAGIEKDDITGKTKRNWRSLTLEEVNEYLKGDGNEAKNSSDRLEMPDDSAESLILGNAKNIEEDLEPDTQNQEAEIKNETLEDNIDAIVEAYVVEIRRMRVVCYNEDLGYIFFFDFLDDLTEFAKSSSIFNQILASVRFLN